MVQPQTARRRLLLVSISSLLALVAVFITLASSARAAEQYGELTRFGSTGDAEGVGQLDEQRTRAIGVDPTDNSVYVVDEPEEQTQSKKILPPTQEEIEECEEEEGKTKQECEAEGEEVGFGPITRHLRLQKFTESTPGTYALSASARFTDISEEFEEGSAVKLGIEGIAVAQEHVYLLAVDARNASLKHDNSQLKGGASEPLLTASTLYAFSTKEQAGNRNLIGAGTEGPNKEVLAGPGKLEAQSDKPGHALLTPSGITVDPSTGEVIILGHIDESGKKADELEGSEDHYALQALTTSGTLGKRYVDLHNKLKENNPEEPPNSPAVATSSGSEHVYLQHGGLVEIPYSFDTATEPTILSTNPPNRSVERGLLASPSVGGALSASPPEGAAAASTIYGITGVKNEAEPERLALAGVLAVAPSGAELGWTGGQVEVESSKTKDNCVIEPLIYASFINPLQVAAGSGGKVFALAPEFLLRNIPLGQKEGGSPLKGPFFSPIIEFGPQPPAPPGNVGCLEASATTPVAEVNGKIVPETTFLSVGTEVGFSSSVTQADALKVEWEFGDGTPVETVAADEFRATAVAHKFTKASASEGFLVKETIHTDNLATPEIVVTGRIHIGEPPPPEAVLEGPRTPKVNEAVTFKDPSPAGITSYEWVFGDGGKETTTVPSAKHAFTKPGEYKVSLMVVNAGGVKSKAVSITVTVSEEQKPPPPPPPPPPSEGSQPPPPSEGNPPPKEQHEVKGFTATNNPEAKLASTALAVSSSGAVVVNVTCPAGENSCTGTVTLRTLGAVVARAGVARAHASKSKAAILTLASGSFTVAGGQVRTVTLHLSSKARKLFTRSKVLRAKATIVAHDPAGVSKTTQMTVTLRASKSHGGKH
jgi:PKD repeat protein